MTTARKEAAARVLEAIAYLTDTHGYPPTYREVGLHLGIAHSHIHRIVERLRGEGLVHDPESSRARALALSGAGRELLNPDTRGE